MSSVVKGISKRHAKQKAQTKITKAALKRLLRRAGNTRAASAVYEEAREVIDYYLEMIVKDAITMTQYSGRKTIFKKDVEYALSRNHRKLYGI
jgi:histone H3/H4